MTDFQIISIQEFTGKNTLPVLVANIGEDVSGKRIKYTDFEGFTPMS